MKRLPNIIISGLAILIFIIAFSQVACAAKASSSSSAEASIYAYDENDIPRVFFFPKEKARWDGSKVTMREWYTLTELQKEKFISEYMGELKKQYKSAIDVMGLDYLKALNLFSYYCNDKCVNEPSVKYIDRLLSGQGKIPQMQIKK